MADEIARLVARIGQVIVGKEAVIRLALACLLARGHLLIEDLPGVGKTTLAHALAKLLGLRYQRIQFTSDLLPSDILGVSVFERASGTFQFHPGPVFAEVLLADEINRATPKAQSALLEAMEERQVTVEGETHALPDPFFVIATQNPSFQVGTFALPESQLDRFLMRVSLGHPGRAAERELLAGEDRRLILERLEPALAPGGLRALQSAVARVHVSEALLDYCQALLEASRASARFSQGLSPRAGLALLRSARAWALMHGRDAVLPEDLQAVLPATVGHRLSAAEDAEPVLPETLAHLLIESVPIP